VTISASNRRPWQGAPTHLYFLAAGLAVTWLGYWPEPREQYDGQVALLGLLLFSTSTAALELLRAVDGSSPLWGPLPQLVSDRLRQSLSPSFASAEGGRHRRPPADTFDGYDQTILLLA